MNKYIFIAIGLIFISCKHELTKVEKKLVDPTKKWVVVTFEGKVTKETSFITELKFFEDGTLIEYYFDCKDQFGKKSEWSYSEEDNALKMYNFYVFKDVTLYEDSIVMTDTQGKYNKVRLFDWNKLPLNR